MFFYLSLFLLATVFLKDSSGQFNNQCPRLLDLVFIIDSSGSVPIAHYNKALQAACDIMYKLNIDPNAVRVGWASYGSLFKSEVMTTSFSQTKDLICQRIKALPYDGGMTATGDAFYWTRTNIFYTLKRSGIYPKVAVLFTDGYSNYGTNNVYVEADALKKEGTSVFVVGIGTGINENELNALASFPVSEYKMTIGNYDLLYNYVNRITNTICGTCAFLPRGVSASRTILDNEYQYYETNTASLVGHIVEIEITDIKGASSLAYSLIQKNPTDFQRAENQMIERMNPDGTRVHSLLIYIPPNSERLYVTTRGIQSFNEYSLNVKEIPFVVGK